MTIDRNETLVSRRRILWGGAFAAAAVATIAAPATAISAQQKPQRKMAQGAVSYQGRPKSGAYCMRCSVFQGPDQCGLVEGPVSPNGWCSLFTPK